MITPVLTSGPEAPPPENLPRGFPPLPTDPETVALFIHMTGIGGKKPNTLRGYASSITAKHRSAKYHSPCHDKVAMVIKSLLPHGRMLPKL